jgi:hypothetical protein
LTRVIESKARADVLDDAEKETVAAFTTTKPTTRDGILAAINYVIGCHSRGCEMLDEYEFLTFIGTIGNAIANLV